MPVISDTEQFGLFIYFLCLQLISRLIFPIEQLIKVFFKKDNFFPKRNSDACYYKFLSLIHTDTHTHTHLFFISFRSYYTNFYNLHFFHQYFPRGHFSVSLFSTTWFNVCIMSHCTSVPLFIEPIAYWCILSYFQHNAATERPQNCSLCYTCAW